MHRNRKQPIEIAPSICTRGFGTLRARGANGSRLQFRRDFASGRWEMRWGRRKQSGPIDSPAFLMGCRGGWRPAVIAVGCVSESPRSRLGPSATSTPYAFVSRVDFTCVSPRSAPTPTRNLGVLSRRVVVGPSFSVRATRNGRRLFGSELTLREQVRRERLLPQFSSCWHQ